MDECLGSAPIIRERDDLVSELEYELERCEEEMEEVRAVQVDRIKTSVQRAYGFSA